MVDQNNEHHNPSKRPRLMDQPVNFNYQLSTARVNNGQPYLVNYQPATAPVIDGQSYFSSFPAGYRFCPTDDELLQRYLIPKVRRQPLDRNKIHEVNLYHHNPEKLTTTHTAAYENDGELKWYFFTLRSKKYRNGKRRRRSDPDGLRRATGTNKEVRDKASGNLLGYKKVLVYYRGDYKRSKKTDWIMNEFRLSKRLSDPTVLDEWVLCRIFYNPEKGKGNNMNGSGGDTLST